MALHQVYKKPNRITAKAVVFIHGLGGSAATWDKDEHTFIQRLKREQKVTDRYDFFIYEYHSRMVEVTWFKRVKAMLPGKNKKNIEFNTSIRDIATELVSVVATQLSSYDTIVLVTHSMGGLVAKNALLLMNADNQKKVKLVLSLSVPHAGSSLARNQLVKLIGSNQVPDLATFSALTNDLTGRYSALTDKPKTIYQRGRYDDVVNEGSAIPANAAPEEQLHTPHTHYSVLEIPDKHSHVPYVRLLTELNDLFEHKQQLTGNEIADAPVNLGIPPNWSLKQTAEIIVKETGFDICYEGFDQNPAEVYIKTGPLSASNTIMALYNLQFRTDEALSPYDVSFVNSRFIFKTKKHE
jgi:pimeloyl-ACP methyl ester carboxylesterase